MRKKLIKRLNKYFPELYGWIEKLLYPRVVSKCSKIDYISINKRNIIDDKVESKCQVRIFTVNNIFTFLAKLPSENYSNGWMQLFQKVKIQEDGKNFASELALLDGDYALLTMNKFAEKITHLEGSRYPIKTFTRPR